MNRASSSTPASMVWVAISAVVRRRMDGLLTGMAPAVASRPITVLLLGSLQCYSLLPDSRNSACLRFAGSAVVNRSLLHHCWGLLRGPVLVGTAHDTTLGRWDFRWGEACRNSMAKEIIVYGCSLIKVYQLPPLL